MPNNQLPRFSVRITDREKRHSITLDAPDMRYVSRMVDALAAALEAGLRPSHNADEEDRYDGPTTTA